MIWELWIRFQGKATWPAISTGYSYPGDFAAMNLATVKASSALYLQSAQPCLECLPDSLSSSEYLAEKPVRKVLYMILAAIGLMIIGRIWNLGFPINKYLWSSSFVCFVGGLSLLLFSVFYYIIDIRGYKKWTLILCSNRHESDYNLPR